jgi:hypothetical protein
VGYCGSLLPVRSRRNGGFFFASICRTLGRHCWMRAQQDFLRAAYRWLERSGNRSALIDAIFNLSAGAAAHPGLTLKVSHALRSYDLPQRRKSMETESDLDFT